MTLKLSYRYIGLLQSNVFCLIIISLFQNVDIENAYLCGYLKIKGLTEEYPTLTTFFDGEIISPKYPFLTRKWDADEEVDRKHWVNCLFSKLKFNFSNSIII